MARKVSISKEVILENALKMLIRDGYSSINIKTLAAEIGCSTQPLVWHFENMEGLRKALSEYAREYAREKAMPKKTSANKESKSGGSAVDIFEGMGKSYVKMALKEPNLFKFLYLGESPMESPYKLSDFSGKKKKTRKSGDEKYIDNTANMIAGISSETGLTEEQAARCIHNTVIYSHGIATMVATGVMKASEKDIMAMIKYASESFLQKELGKNL